MKKLLFAILLFGSLEMATAQVSNCQLHFVLAAAPEVKEVLTPGDGTVSVELEMIIGVFGDTYGFRRVERATIKLSKSQAVVVIDGDRSILVEVANDWIAEHFPPIELN